MPAQVRSLTPTTSSQNEVGENQLSPYELDDWTRVDNTAENHSPSDYSSTPSPELPTPSETPTEEPHSLLEDAEEISYQLHDQLKRDVDMQLQGTLQAGDDQAVTLQRLWVLLACADIHYQRQGQWHLWREQNQLPIAAVLSHGSRILIEFEDDALARLAFAWLFHVNPEPTWDSLQQSLSHYTRLWSTHAIEPIQGGPVLVGQHKKHLAECKLGKVQALTNGLKETLLSSGPFQLGLDLAIGGCGNQNPFSGSTITADGKHGHLYAYVYHSEEKSGLLLGMEQSAPSYADQYGGDHDWRTQRKPLSVTGGGYFASDTDISQDKALSGIGPDEYYDSIYAHISQSELRALQAIDKALSDDNRYELQIHLKALLASSGSMASNPHPIPPIPPLETPKPFLHTLTALYQTLAEWIAPHVLVIPPNDLDPALGYHLLNLAERSESAQAVMDPALIARLEELHKQLSVQHQGFLIRTLQVCDKHNYWKNPSSTHNSLAPYANHAQAKLGRAFIPQEKESSILFKLLSGSQARTDQGRTTIYEPIIENAEFRKNYPQFMGIVDFFSTTHSLITMINALCRDLKDGLINLKDGVDYICGHMRAIQMTFSIYRGYLASLLAGDHPIHPEATRTESNYYPIDQPTLEGFSPDQLLTLWLDHYNLGKATDEQPDFIQKIIVNEALLLKLYFHEQAAPGEFDGRNTATDQQRRRAIVEHLRLKVEQLIPHIPAIENYCNDPILLFALFKRVCQQEQYSTLRDGLQQRLLQVLRQTADLNPLQTLPEFVFFERRCTEYYRRLAELLFDLYSELTLNKANDENQHLVRSTFFKAFRSAYPDRLQAKDYSVNDVMDTLKRYWDNDKPFTAQSLGIQTLLRSLRVVSDKQPLLLNKFNLEDFEKRLRQYQNLPTLLCFMDEVIAGMGHFARFSYKRTLLKNCRNQLATYRDLKFNQIQEVDNLFTNFLKIANTERTQHKTPPWGEELYVTNSAKVAERLSKTSRYRQFETLFNETFNKLKGLPGVTEIDDRCFSFKAKEGQGMRQALGITFFQRNSKHMAKRLIEGIVMAP